MNYGFKLHFVTNREKAPAHASELVAPREFETGNSADLNRLLPDPMDLDELLRLSRDSGLFYDYRRQLMKNLFEARSDQSRSQRTQDTFFLTISRKSKLIVVAAIALHYGLRDAQTMRLLKEAYNPDASVLSLFISEEKQLKISITAPHLV